MALPPLTQGRPCPRHLGFPTSGSLGVGPCDCALPAPSHYPRLQSTAEGVFSAGSSPCGCLHKTSLTCTWVRVFLGSRVNACAPCRLPGRSLPPPFTSWGSSDPAVGAASPHHPASVRDLGCARDGTHTCSLRPVVCSACSAAPLGPACRPQSCPCCFRPLPPQEAQGRGGLARGSTQR